MKPSIALSAEEARGLALRAQGLVERDGAPADVADLLRSLGAVQLDTISVLARSHELVAYARLGPIPRAEVESAYWGTPARSFEYWGHANCILPIEAWPWFAFRRRAFARLRRWTMRQEVLDEVRARLRDGPVSASDVGGARSGPGGWWSWSEAKIALEWMYRRGDVVCSDRRGWRRIYDLAERALPPALLAIEPSDEECYERLVRASARALGVGTARDIAGYFHLLVRHAGAAADAPRLLRQAIEAAGLVPVEVEGWPEVAYADPVALAASPGERSRTTLLSPFDSLIWATPRSGELKERERIRRLFGFSYSFEAYVPKAQRRHGYYTMPLLTDGRLAGLVDPKREGRTLVAQRVSIERAEDVAAMAAALREAAAWVGSESVRVEDVRPGAQAAPLRRLLS
jgi:hypothetical protein